MKRVNWHRQHKWFGIVSCFFLLMFCLSGILLNHRDAVSHWEVDRRWLPARYAYTHWNGGLLRGTLPYEGSVLVYGANGIWITDSACTQVASFNRGLPAPADFRQVRNVIQARSGELYAVTPSGVYSRPGKEADWISMPIPINENEKLSDIASRGDTLVVVGRSALYVSPAQGEPFRPLRLAAAAGDTGKVTLFRTLWLLHSGELFGTAGKWLVDAIALILILLCLTGLAYWLLPFYIRRRRRKHPSATAGMCLLRALFSWHDKIGRYTIVLTLLIAFTGWCLRPPLMIPLALTRTKPLPGSTLDNPNPWHDKLRLLRYDDTFGDWLLSTSEGIHTLRSLHDVPKKVPHTPPVSVMGLNVWQKDSKGHWLCGSFSGLFAWDRQSGKSVDYFTHKPAPEKPGAPFGKKAIAGYSDDFRAAPFPVEYSEGTTAIPQPDSLSILPMSLWNVALEVHSGRIYIGTYATLLFVFIIGGACIWSLVTGYKIRQKKNRISTKKR